MSFIEKKKLLNNKIVFFLVKRASSLNHPTILYNFIAQGENNNYPYEKIIKDVLLKL